MKSVCGPMAMESERRLTKYKQDGMEKREKGNRKGN